MSGKCGKLESHSYGCKKHRKCHCKKTEFVGLSLPIVSDENIIIQGKEKYFIDKYEDTGSVWYNEGFKTTKSFPQFLIVSKTGKYAIKATLTFCQLSSNFQSGSPVLVKLLKGKINDDVVLETITTGYASQISVDDEDFDQQNVQVHIVIDLQLKKKDTISLQVVNNLDHAIILSTGENSSHLSIEKID
jgi:hypothetical protein